MLSTAFFAGPAAADAPPGPPIATVAFSQADAKAPDGGLKVRMSLLSVDPAAGRRLTLRRGHLSMANGNVAALFGASVAWSSDGRLIAFGGFGEGESERSPIYVVGADGRGSRPLPGTRGGTDPVFSPDGRTLAFARSRFHISRNFLKDPDADLRLYSSTTAWVVDLAGGKPRRLTRWRNGLDNTPGSFTADGSGLLVTEEDERRSGERIVQLELAGGQPREVLREASNPSLSPDGTRLAFISNVDRDSVDGDGSRERGPSEIYVASADGSGATRITYTDDAAESSPSWDPSGQRLAYVRTSLGSIFTVLQASRLPAGNSLMQVNADGSCPQRILSKPNAFLLGATWQPGPGREAGPIVC
jgi:Tol biopolymer transport system component